MAEVITEMVLPGVYIEVRPEGLISVGGISTGRIGIVGTAARGPINQVVSLSNYTQTKDIFGDYDSWLGGSSDKLTLVRALEQAFKNGASDVRAVRIGGSSTNRASAVLQDRSSNDQIRIQAKDPGEWANNGTMKVEMNVEQKVKRFKVPKADTDSDDDWPSTTAPFNNDLTVLQLENTNLVRKDGINLNLRLEDIEIKNLSKEEIVKYSLGNSLPTSETYNVDEINGRITFGAPQTKGEILEVSYFVIKRTVISNEKKNVDENHMIVLDRLPVDNNKMRVLVGTTVYSKGDTAEEGKYILSDNELTFNASVPKETLVTVTYRYAPVSRVIMSLPTGEQEIFKVENAQDLANKLAEKDDTLFRSQIIANETEQIKTNEKTLIGGNNGADAEPADYIPGFSLLENEEVNIVLAAGLSASQFTSELQGHVESMESQGKDRIGLVGSELGDDADKIKEHTEALSHRRMILVAPGIKVIDSIARKEVTLPGSYAAAAVAGKLASLAVHISPTNKVLSVRGLEYEFFRAEKKDLVQNRVLLLEKKEGYRVIRGITTDSGAFKQITTRRIVDKVKAGIRMGSLPFIGRLNNERIRKALKGALDAFLNSMVQDEALQSYELEVTATRHDEIAGKAIVTVGLRPTFSIDYIKVIMNLS